ncbi:DUF2474 family protein [Acidisphaera rubrifaciens]|nr:DUF2474 family protein [Acidisphaera rubrifaciens]
MADGRIAPPPNRLRRVLWFVALYAAGVVITGAVAYGLKMLLPG